MAKSSIITGLDIGSNDIKILVAMQKDEELTVEVMSQAKLPSFGVRKGVVVDIDKVSNIIKSLLDKVEMEIGQNVNSVYVNINGSHLFSVSSRGVVAVSRADQKISETDIDRVLQSAQTISLSSNKEILDVFPKEYIVDGEQGIKEPIGMQGGRLEAEVLILCGFSPYKNNLTQAILNANLQILDIIPSSIASASAVLLPKQKELGVAVLDIGAGTSELAVFKEENLIHLAVFPIGSANITDDIAIGLQTDINIAEMIKIEYGNCFLRGSSKKEKIETKEETLVFSQKMLSKIIEARVSDIFEQTQEELKKISKQGLLPAGLVLTGGGAKLTGIVELAKKKLKLPCRIGKSINFSGIEDDPSYATVCGLVLQGINEGVTSSTIFRQEIGAKLKKIFKIFIP
ncbi:cell division protein FtsA [Dehalococcoidia bacterium]|nr:cell division protein FtsA [Dehalococcoidia bacterium]